MATVKEKNAKKETEGIVLAAQNQGLRTKWVCYHIDKEPELSG